MNEQDRKRTRLRPLGVAAAALTVTALLGACSNSPSPDANHQPAGGTALAAGSPTPSKPDPVISAINGADLSHPVEESPDEISQYWTTDQLRTAQQPATPMATDGSFGAADLGLNVKVDPTVAPEHLTSQLANSGGGHPWGKIGATARTVGRLYYKFGNTNMVCSAAIVSSHSQTLVATAGHCMWNTKTGGWATHILFIPGDSNNGASSPFGRWTASKIYIPREFWRGAHENAQSKASGNGWVYDVAFIRMNPLGGRKIQAKLGSQGITFNGVNRNVLVLGYPTARPFDGRSMRYCSNTRILNGRLYSDWTMPCVMTPGASGGPWLANYANGVGYLTTTTSLTDGHSLYGAHWGKLAYSLYQQADRGA